MNVPRGIQFTPPPPSKIGQQDAELGARKSEFLTGLVFSLNDRATLPELDRFPEWRTQSPVTLDAPWPD